VHPFIIQTGNMETRVVGTSFNVTALPQSKTYKVSVITGKVQVTAKDKQGIVHSILLQPKQQSSFNLQSSELAFASLSDKVIKTQYWKPFSLQFEDASMEEVKTQLEKAFSVKVLLQNKNLANCRLRANFTNEKLPQIMGIIEKLLDVTCVLDDNNILSISGEGCPD
jgi:ferric-dicitrate binding protein FerR (iron transport regulator)